MGGRLAGILAIGVFVIAVAMTPLGSILYGGVYDSWLTRSHDRGPVGVLVHDQTGIVAAAATYPNDGVDWSVDGSHARVLVVPWSVCGGRADLVFSRTATGYEAQAPTVEFGWCSWFTGSTNGVTALSLRAPIDTSEVDFTGLEASVW